MPASLSNQVRLGFSLGWRIWTPNEVGFYAKTLAHSYFIFTILRSKFLKKRIWIINYSIFIAAMKYLVFVEFIEFGIKTKEERCYWKKIMYISLLIRHKKYRSKVKYTPNFEKMKSVTRFFSAMERSRALAWSTKLKFTQRYAPKVVSKFSKFKRINYVGKLQDVITLVENKLNTDKIDYENLILERVEPTMPPESNSEYTKIAHSVMGANLLNFQEGSLEKFQWTNLKWGWRKFRKFRKFRKKGESTGAIVRNLTKIPLRLRGSLLPFSVQYIIPSTSFETMSEILGRKIRNSNKRRIYFEKKTPVPAIFGYGKVFGNIIRRNYQKLLSGTENIYPWFDGMSKVRGELLISIEKMHLIRRKAATFSIAGGPRKRLFRNIKRSFQGKYIVKYATLIWFWEKVSKLITYIIKRLTSRNKIKKKIFRSICPK